jgi:hypothetical protein
VGELNTLADLLSRTVERNRYTFDPAALHQSKHKFDFDLYGSALHSLAPSFPTASVYRRRLSVVVPPWPRILPLLSELASDRPKIKG